jgi:hypothetical protein
VPGIYFNMREREREREEAKKPNNLPEFNLHAVVLFLDSINFIAEVL